MWSRFFSSTTYSALYAHGFFQNYILRLAHLVLHFSMSLVVSLFRLSDFDGWTEASFGLRRLLSFAFQCVKSDAISLILTCIRIHLFLNNKSRISKVLRHISFPPLKEVFLSCKFKFLVNAISYTSLILIISQISEIASLKCLFPIAQYATSWISFLAAIRIRWRFFNEAGLVIDNLCSKLWWFVGIARCKTMVNSWVISSLFDNLKFLFFCSFSF